jgi:hypothetical protein
MRIQTQDGNIYEVVNAGGTRVLVDFKELAVEAVQDHCECGRCERFRSMKAAMSNPQAEAMA